MARELPVRSAPSPVQPTTTRKGAVRQGVWIELFTIVWMVIEASVALYTVAWEEDNKHLKEISNPRLIQTRYQSPQLTLFELGPDDWLLFKKVPAYAPRKRRKRGAIIQLPLPELESSITAV